MQTFLKRRCRRLAPLNNNMSLASVSVRRDGFRKTNRFWDSLLGDLVVIIFDKSMLGGVE